MIPSRLHASSLVTSMFLHGGWLHLIGNMWFLWIFGDNVEDILGHAKYLLFYLLCGVAAALFQVALNMDSRVPTIGASGAIAGVMGAYLVKFPRSRIVTLVFVLFFLTTIEIPASLILIYWFVLQFFSGVGRSPPRTFRRAGGLVRARRRLPGRDYVDFCVAPAGALPAARGVALVMPPKQTLRSTCSRSPPIRTTWR